MNKNDSVKMFFVIVFSFVVGGIVTISLFKWTPLLSEIVSTSTTGGTVITKGGAEVYEKSSLAASVKKVYDSVAVVEGYQQNQLSSTGTGFVYKVDDKYGYVMTNHHVISGAEKVVLIRSDDKEIEGVVLGSDEYLDLAVIRINKSDVIDTAVIGTSEKSKLGDTVFTIGSPLGYEYRGTVTDGILSGKDRLVTVSLSGTNDWVMKVLQTNAAVNPGNSGGPLVNASGEVIGVISLKLVQTEVENMGFAIPIEYAMSHIESLESGKAITRPMLGISMINASDTYSLYRNGIMLKDNVTTGVVVVEISKNSGASKSDLQKGDVVTKINNEKVDNMAYLRYELYKYNAGDEITLTYLRDGKERTTKVKLTEYKED